MSGAVHADRRSEGRCTASGCFAGRLTCRGRHGHTAYDADHLRQAIAAKGALAVIPNNPSWFGSGPWFRASEGTVRMQRYAWSIDKWWEVKRNGPSRGKLRPSVVDRSYRCRTLGRHRPISHNIRAKFQAETVPICQDGSVWVSQFLLGRWNKK